MVKKAASKKIVLASDPFGVSLKSAIKEHLLGKGYEVIDLGTDSIEHFVPYFEISAKAARAVQSGVAERAIIFCGSGMGMALTANKFKGIYCGLCESEFTTEMCRIVNNCNVLAMGAKVITEQRAKNAVDLWLNTEFGQGMDTTTKKLLKEGVDELAKIEAENFK